ncbi:putative selenium-dependent hydroxylase accessory protein YqeC [Lutibacter sp. B2]|nr:putative selenium-dependent hydroxylase accessory protein YqeC [Lutibacter sp. B2]
MKLWEVLEFKKEEMISLVGGGGKTTTMYALAKDLKLLNKKVLVSTTTAIYLPEREQVQHMIISETEKNVDKRLRESAEKSKIVGLGRSITKENKLKGISPKEMDEIYEKRYFDIILVEADGAKHKSLKAPDTHEPVIPKKSTIVIIVVGMDACGEKFSSNIVHRPEQIAEITGIKYEEIITPDIITNIVISDKGLLKGIPENAKVFLLINKVDTKERYTMAREIGIKVREKDTSKIEKILLCNMQKEQVVGIM